MKPLLTAERSCAIAHVFSMLFGLAGLVLVLPNADFIINLPPVGQVAFDWSMAYGGVVFMVLGTAAVAFYAYRVFGWWAMLTFALPAVGLSLSSELLGTATGFPFGHYHYLSGLGYKIAGRVPFTIPLSWFYVGFSTYVVARAGLEGRGLPGWLRSLGSVAIGSLLLTFWDFVLDPAMSQTMMPFWLWEQPGAFFGMPYQNFVGWFATGVVFMSAATLLWPKAPLGIARRQLNLPIAIYAANLAFGGVLSAAAGFWIPVALTVVFAALPTFVLYRSALAAEAIAASEAANPVRPASVSVASVGVLPK